MIFGDNRDVSGQFLEDLEFDTKWCREMGCTTQRNGVRTHDVHFTCRNVLRNGRLGESIGCVATNSRGVEMALFDLRHSLKMRGLIFNRGYN